MGMITVTVRNATGIDVKIQEGSAGVFVTRAVVTNGGTYKLKLDPNATYREYVLISLPDNTALEPVFSSDDVVELREILIRKEGSGYVWEGISATAPALAPEVAPSPEAAPSPETAPPTGFLSNIMKFCGLSS